MDARPAELRDTQDRRDRAGDAQDSRDGDAALEEVEDERAERSGIRSLTIERKRTVRERACSPAEAMQLRVHNPRNRKKRIHETNV